MEISVLILSCVILGLNPVLPVLIFFFFFLISRFVTLYGFYQIKYIHTYDISAIEKLESMCHDRVGWKARYSMREPRETSPLSSVSAQHVMSDCS